MAAQGAKARGYPSTPHLPFSQAVAEDDVSLSDADAARFVGIEVVITEKMDGGNCCLADGKVYARTHAKETTHKWFGPIKAMYAGIRHLCAADEELYGENMTAIHSIEYDGLTSYFYLFGVRRKAGPGAGWLSWDACEERAAQLGVETTPRLFRGTFQSVEELRAWMEQRMREPSARGTAGPEGFVIRRADGFTDAEFEGSIAKFVRADHIQTKKNFKSTWKQAALI